MSKKFTVVKYADQVNEKYIRDALEHCYKGRSYEKKFSDKLVRVLLSDYKKKMLNLAWYFKDEDGRIQNYKILQPTPEKVLDDAKKNSNIIRDILNWLGSVGAEYSAQDFINNKCIIKKQQIKITKAVHQRDTSIHYLDSCFAKGQPNEGIIASVNFTKYFKDGNITSGDLIHQITHAKLYYSGVGCLATTEDGSLNYALIPDKYVTLTVKDSLSGLSTDKLSQVFGNIGAEQMKVSMDLADMITSSTGNASSCLSVDNCHHSNTIINFRSDFAVIAFTNDPNDRLKKRGRAWLFLRLTEKGFKREIPFWKQQQSYGTVTSAHTALILEDIRSNVKVSFGYSKNDFTKEDRGVKWFQASPNVLTNENIGHTAAPGHLDSSGSGDKGWFILKTKLDKFFTNAETPLTFPDTLGLDGNINNSFNFTKDYGSSNYYGSLSANNYEVTCSATGKTVLDSDAVCIEDKWYSKDILGTLITGKTVAQVEAEEEVEEVAKVVVEEDTSNVDVDDF